MLMSFGGRMRECRQIKDLSQEQLAKLLLVNRRTIGSWETNVNEPSVEMIGKIADVLGVTTDYLILGRE